MEEHAENAEARAKNLQAALNGHRGDIAFFTQPIIAGHSGSRAFANYRNKLYARYDRGYEEYKKSAYFRDKAETARQTASGGKLKDAIYLHNRIKECNITLKKLQANITAYENNLYRLNNGEELKTWRGDLMTVEGQEQGIENQLEKYDYEAGKLEFFEGCMSDIGGVQFSKDNIKPGYIVEIKRWGRCRIEAAGPVNVTYTILDGGAHGGVLTDPYAAIVKIIAAQEAEKPKNPFVIGDLLVNSSIYDRGIRKAYQVMGVTDTGVRIRQIAVKDNKPVADGFVSDDIKFRKVTKSKFSEFVGVYEGNWQLDKYTV